MTEKSTTQAASKSDPAPKSTSDTTASAPTEATAPTSKSGSAAEEVEAIDTEALLAEKVDTPESPEGVIDLEVFQQIRDMDEEEEEGDGDDEPNAFSKSIVWGFFEQAEVTFKQMEEALNEPSLSKLSSLGHFLKGSSAALGIIKVQEACERIQHYGNLRDEEAGVSIGQPEALKKIRESMLICIKEYRTGKAWLMALYEDGEE